MKTLILLSFLIALVCTDNWWTDCSVKPVFHYTQLDIEPSPPKIGKNISVSAIGTFDVASTNPSAVLAIQYQVANQWISLPKMTLHWCDYQPCPIPAGPFKGAFSYEVPRITPSGNYRGNILATTEAKAQIACINFTFNFQP